MGVAVLFFQFMISINLALGIFNLLPIPPLDGSKLFGVILPDRTYFSFVGMGSRYGMIILLVLIATNQLVPIISTVHRFLFTMLLDIARFIYT